LAEFGKVSLFLAKIDQVWTKNLANSTSSMRSSREFDQLLNLASFEIINSEAGRSSGGWGGIRFRRARVCE
jgi:hypothetical protein